MKKDKLDAFIALEDTTLHIHYANTNPQNTMKVKMIVQNVLSGMKVKEMSSVIQKMELERDQKINLPDFSVDNSYIYDNENSSPFDKIFSILIAFIIFLFAFLDAAISMYQDRKSGKLRKIFHKQHNANKIALSYLTSYGIFGVIQALLIVFYSKYVLNIYIVGNFYWIIFIGILLALSAQAIGIFIALFIRSEFQMMKIIPFIILLQLLFSGLVPLDTMAHSVQGIAYLTPVHYASQSILDIIIKGEAWNAIQNNSIVLLVFIILFTILNAVALNKVKKNHHT